MCIFAVWRCQNASLGVWSELVKLVFLFLVGSSNSSAKWQFGCGVSAPWCLIASHNSLPPPACQHKLCAKQRQGRAQRSANYLRRRQGSSCSRGVAWRWSWLMRLIEAIMQASIKLKSVFAHWCRFANFKWMVSAGLWLCEHFFW